MKPPTPASAITVIASAGGRSAASDRVASDRDQVGHLTEGAQSSMPPNVGLIEDMAAELPSRSAGAQEIELSLPFTGLWVAGNSPARRVPSHGTDLFGTRYAIDFIAVDDRHRTAGSRDWRTFLATEPPERFFAFGQPILAPTSGTIAYVHDAELDHQARRAQLALVPYAFGQAARVRRGAGAIAGNYVTISLPDGGSFVLLAHLQAGSIRVSVGQEVVEGQQIANCGNSGNSTQPHLHMQAMDSADPSTARGLPMTFRRFREWTSGTKQFQVKEWGMPGEGAVVEPSTQRPPPPSRPARTGR